MSIPSLLENDLIKLKTAQPILGEVNRAQHMFEKCQNLHFARSAPFCQIQSHIVQCFKFILCMRSLPVLCHN